MAIIIDTNLHFSGRSVVSLNSAINWPRLCIFLLIMDYGWSFTNLNYNTSSHLGTASNVTVAWQILGQISA